MVDQLFFLNSTHLFVNWTEPESPNGDLRYEVNVTDPLTNLLSVLLSVGVAGSVSSSAILPVERMFYRDYEVSVVPFTAAGRGGGASGMLQTPEGGRVK